MLNQKPTDQELEYAIEEDYIDEHGIVKTLELIEQVCYHKSNSPMVSDEDYDYWTHCARELGTLIDRIKTDE